MAKRRGPPIDRGWAWMIALGVFIKSLINGGFVKSYGIFFAAFTDTYGRSASETQLVRSARSISATLTGPFGTALSERFTERTVVIIGALFMSVGFILAFFAESLEFLIFTFGICGGIGVSLVNGPSRVCLGRYFDKKRGRANSLSLMGASVGQIAIPPLISLLMSTYALRGTMLIYGGVCLHVIITGALLRPLQSYSTDTKEQDDSKTPGDTTNLSKASQEPEENCDHGNKYTGKDDGALHSSNGSQGSPKGADFCSNGVIRNSHFKAEYERPQLLSVGSKSSEEHFRGSSRSLTEHFRHLGSHMSVNTIEDEEPIEVTSMKSEPSVKSSRPRCSMCLPLINFFKFIFDRRVMLNPLYVMYLVTSSMFMVANTNQVTFLVPRAEEVGLTREMAAVLLSIVGGCDFCGRFVFGILADIKCLKSHHVMAFGVILASSCMYVLPFTQTFPQMAGVSAVFGILGSSHAILQLPVLVDFVGKEQLAKAVGMGIFFRGMFSSILAPLLGLVKDRSGTFNMVFYVTASMQVLGALILIILEPIARRKQNAREKRYKITVETEKLNC